MDTLSLDQLRTIVEVGRRDFLTAQQRKQMLTEIRQRDECRGLDRKASGEYLGNKIRYAPYPLVLVSAEWIKSTIGNHYYKILEDQSLCHSQL